jgi:hypothetical protein
MSNTPLKLDSQSLTSIIGKTVYFVLTILITIIGYLITDKLNNIQKRLEKIDVLEERVETLNKSQIQIMTHLKIPVPDYLFSTMYINHRNGNNLPIPFNNDNYVKNYLYKNDELKTRAIRSKRC